MHASNIQQGSITNPLGAINTSPAKNPHGDVAKDHYVYIPGIGRVPASWQKDIQQQACGGTPDFEINAHGGGLDTGHGDSNGIIISGNMTNDIQVH